MSTPLICLSLTCVGRNSKKMMSYSTKGTNQTLSGLKEKDVSGIIAGVNDDLSAFTQHAIQYDDITMLAVKYNG